MRAEFAPENTPGGLAQLQPGAFGGEGIAGEDLAVGVEPNEFAAPVDAAADGVEASPGLNGAGVGGVVFTVRGQLHGRGVRCPAVCRPRPLRAQGISYHIEAIANPFSSRLLYRPAVVVQTQPVTLPDIGVEALCELRVVGIGAHAGLHHITYAVVVRCVETLRTVAPAPEVARLAGIEGGAYIFEKIGAAAPSAAGQGCFGNDGITFEKHGASVNRQRACRHLAKKEFQVTEGLAAAELHLSDVTAFVHRQLLQGRQADAVVGIAAEHKFHTAGRPGDIAVVVGDSGVQDDGKRTAVVCTRLNAYAASERTHRQLEFGSAGPSEAVKATGIDYPVALRLDITPSLKGTFVARCIELGS